MNKIIAPNNALNIKNHSLSPSILLDNYKPTNVSTSELSLKATIYRYISILKDGWKKILITTLIFMFLAVLLAVLTNASYTAQATIRISPDSTQYLEYRVDAKKPTSSVNDEFFYNTENRILRSRSLAKQVIQDLNIEKTLLEEKKYKGIVYFFRSPIKQFFKGVKAIFKSSSDSSGGQPEITAEDIYLEKLEISPVRNSRLVSIEYTSNDPVLAKNVVNKLVNKYILSKHLNKKAVADNASEFLNLQLDKARKSLLAAESDLINYSKSNDIIDLDSDKSIVASNLESLNNAYMNALNKRIAIQQSFVRKKDISANSRYLSDPIVQSYKRELSNLNFLYQENLKKYKSKHPRMVSLVSRIDEVKRSLILEFNRLKSNEDEAFQASLDVALQVENELKEQIKSYENKLLKYRDNNIEYSRLKREVGTSEVIYTGLLKRLKEVGVASIVEDNVLVVDSPEVPHKKDSPSLKKYLVLGFLLGFLSSLATVLFKEILSPIIRSSDDIESVSGNYKVLATLPKVKSKKGIVNFVNNKKTIRYFQNIYTSIPLEGLFPKCLLVTSATKNEGKTAVAVNLAVSIAKLNKTVLLIDANLQDPKIHKYFNLNNIHGLSDFLTGEDKDILNTVMKEKLFVITAGQDKQDPMTILSNPKFLKFLEVSSNMFDHIIIDSSPILSCSESRIIANQTSATLMVVGEKKVLKKEIKDTLSLLNRAGATLVGFVNNMSTTKLNA